MQIRVVKEFSFLNVLVVLLIVNLILDILCPIHVGMLYFFKIPITNILYYVKESPLLIFVSFPWLFAQIITIYLIPLCVIALFVERHLIKCGRILPKERIEFSKKKKIFFRIILTLAILAYIVSLGACIHTMIPYSPEELEQLRYD